MLIVARAIYRLAYSRPPIRPACCLNLSARIFPPQGCLIAAMPDVASPHVLSFWDKAPPLAAAAAAKLAQVPLDIKADPKGSKDTVTCLTLPAGDVFIGGPLILRYLARSSRGNEIGLFGRDALSSTQIDYWIDYSCANVSAGANFEVDKITLEEAAVKRLTPALCMNAGCVQRHQRLPRAQELHRRIPYQRC